MVPSLSGFLYGSHVQLYPDFGAEHHWGYYQTEQLIRTPGQGWMAEVTTTASHSRWMGSAAEGAPELDTGIAETSAVFHPNFTS